MQEKSNTKRNLVIVLVIIAAVAAAGYFYANRDRSSSDLLTSTSVDGTTDSIEGDLLKTLTALQKLKLDDTIFDNPVFSSFTDFSKPLTPQQSGRTNPFAPLDASVLATTTIR